MKIGIMIVALMSVTSPSYAQSKAAQSDFSGVWKLERKALYQSAREVQVQHIVPGVRSNGLPIGCEIQVLIEHADPKLVIRRIAVCREKPKVEKVRTYYTDARGEENLGIDGKPANTKTRWVKNRIVITTYRLDSKGRKRAELVRTLSITKDLDSIVDKSSDSERIDVNDYQAEFLVRSN